MKPSAIAKTLTNTEGMVLRYVDARPEPVVPTRVTTQIEWSHLPKTYLDAKRVFDSLFERQLICKVNKKGYAATRKGSKVVAFADVKGMWRTVNGKPPVSSRRNFK
jgi:hypothetical protein